MLVVIEESLSEGEGDEHQLVVVFDLVDGEGSCDERMLMPQRLIGAKHVDPPGTFGCIEMQRSGEMGIDTYLCRQSASKDGAFESPVPDGEETVGEDRIDMRGALEEAVHTHDTRRQLMIFVPHECGLLQLHGDSIYVLARVQRSDRQRVGAQGLSFGRNNQ